MGLSAGGIVPGGLSRGCLSRGGSARECLPGKGCLPSGGWGCTPPPVDRMTGRQV